VINSVLFKDIDEPGLNTLDVYQRRGGYSMLRKALHWRSSSNATEARSSRPPRSTQTSSCPLHMISVTDVSRSNGSRAP
jgi:hypothetical protein